MTAAPARPPESNWPPRWFWILLIELMMIMISIILLGWKTAYLLIESHVIQ